MPIGASLRSLAFALGALVLSALVFSAPVFSATPAARCARSENSIPQRSPQAQSASDFIRTASRLNERERERVIRSELIAGNIPSFLHKLQPIALTGQLPDGGTIRLVLCVMADYLSLGADDDFLLVPMGLDTALAVGARFGFTLPTRRIVDLIYRQSKVQMKPQPLPPGDQMRSSEYYQLHDSLVKEQRATHDSGSRVLIAGHKKDLILSPRLWSQPGKVAIYGWHRNADSPIQPLSTVHGATYADYSHGVRLVSKVAFVNGEPRSIFDLLADPVLAHLISDEGLLPRAAESLGAAEN